MRKRITFLSCLVGCLISCQSEKVSEGQEVTLTNTSSVNLVEKAISIKRSELPGIPDGELYPLVLSQSGDTIPA